MTASFPNGIAAGVKVNGLPLTITNPGEIFWVNSSAVLPVSGVGGAVGAGGRGKGTYNRPFATINQALGACTANRGDIVLVMPGYTETISSAAAGLLFNKAGTAVVGLGAGSLKPTITLDGIATADINWTADDMSAYNLRFVAGIANINHCLQVSGADARIDSCEFLSGGATFSFLTSIISTATAFGLQITNCIINQESTVGGVAVTDVAASGIETLADNTVIKDNVFLGEFSTAMIFNQTTAAEGLIITDNVGQNYSTAAAAGAVSLDTSCSGMIYRNNFGVLEATSIDGLIINGNCGMIENYFVNVEAETGGIVGTPSG